jgi:lipopolysaccharide export system protein LptA
MKQKLSFNPRCKPVFAIIIFMMITSNAFALPEDKNQLAQLEANQVEFDTETHQGAYYGNVKFAQGSSHLEADEAHTQFDDHNQIVYAKALATTSTQTHFWTKMNPQDPEFHAYAKQIEYFPDKHLIILKGEAQIIQGENTMASPIMEYNMLTHHLTTKANGSLRTRLLIHPDKKA